MNEIKNILTTIKARWHEAVLIIGLNIIASVAIMTVCKDQPQNLVFLTMLFALSLILMSAILRLGFLRTFHTNGTDNQQAGFLLKSGLHFLRPMASLVLLYTLPFILIFLVVNSWIGPVGSTASEAAVDLNSYIWIQQISHISINVILMKFILLLPAVVIVMNCKIASAFENIKGISIFRNFVLIKLFVIQNLIILVSTFFAVKYPADSFIHYAFDIAMAILLQFLSLLISMLAVKFVADAVLVYDDDTDSVEIEQVIEE